MNMKLDGASAPRVLPQVDTQAPQNTNAQADPAAHTSTPQLPYNPQLTSAYYHRPIDGDGSAGKHASDDEIKQTASDILKTGDRFLIADDYDSRMVKFSQEMATLDPESRGKLVQELLKQDHGALQSWMKLDILDRMHNEGRTDDVGYAAISDGIAQAYQGGKIDQNSLETFLQIPSLGRVAPAIASKPWNQLRDFLAADGQSPAMQGLREQLAGRLLSSDNTYAPHNAGIAMQLAADSGDPTMAARIFAQVPADKRDAVLNAIGQSSIGFQNSMGAVKGLQNPLATLIDSIAQPAGKDTDALAVQIARYASSASHEVFYDMYSDKPIGPISTAMSDLLTGTHGNAVLNALTNWDETGVPGKDGHAQQFGENAIELGNVLRLTAFNPDNKQSSDVMTVLSQWTKERKDIANSGQEKDGISVSQAREQLGMLGGAAMDGVEQLKIDQDQRAAANEQLVNFVVDVALSAVPGGGTISGVAGKQLKDVFGNNEKLNGVIDKALEGSDSLSSSQVDALKKKLTDTLNGDQGALETFRQNASVFVEKAVLNGLSENGVAPNDIVKDHIQNVLDNIDDNRK
jgi:hypothetical protein